MIDVIIPSRDADNLRACIAALRQHERHMRIWVVDDGIDESFWRENGDIHRLYGVKDFVFARNINIGIRAALDHGARWLVLMNDDALLRTPSGLAHMTMVWPDRVALAAPTCTNVGNPAQWPRGLKGWAEERRMVCFTCVVIPSWTIERVGLLDERYTAYGYEDNDYCRRVRATGYKIAICHDCVIDHGSLPSTYRRHGPVDLAPGAAIYRSIWGEAP